jgi:hypothetical protein
VPRRDADSFQFDRPILVTGTPRSGKSLVARILRHAPEFLWLGEPGQIWDIGMGTQSDDRRTADDATASVRRRIRNACQRALEQNGKPRYLDDLAYHALRIPFIMRVLPEARIVHVVRDPTHTIPEMTYWWSRPSEGFGRTLARKRSTLQLHTLPRLAMRYARNWLHGRLRGRPASWGPAVPGLEAFRRDHSQAEIAAFQWQRLMEIALDDLEALPITQRLEVRYEDLLSDPAGSVARLAGFCEVLDAESLVEIGSRYIEPDHPIYGQVAPSASDWAAIEERIAPLRRRLGYAAPSPISAHST